MEFKMGSVPVSIAAKVYGKDACWVREGMKSGVLPIGVVTKKNKRSNYYISPKLLYEHTGYAWKGEKNEHYSSGIVK